MNFIHNEEDTVLWAGIAHTVKSRFHNEGEEVYSNKGNSSKNMYFIIPQNPALKEDEERWVWVPESQIMSI